MLNECRLERPDGEPKRAEGYAKIDDPVSNAKLRVTFFWPFFGDYWILELGPEYSYSVVGHPSRDYLWILEPHAAVAPGDAGRHPATGARAGLRHDPAPVHAARAGGGCGARAGSGGAPAVACAACLPASIGTSSAASSITTATSACAGAWRGNSRASTACSVRLWVDDLASFARINPEIDPALPAQSSRGVEVRHWLDPFRPSDLADGAADVVIEAFACHLPAGLRRGDGGACARSRSWINLEYLSAENWVARLPRPGLAPAAAAR
ncbi:MAG: elongation factor P maturation arginine rhamnosyltransferase EarP [Comamonadaceae bacterium]|nr:elongation factor P maturation arginine rhamnosyltransferase EarP [Comamonadaceae bacterium]